MIGNRKLLTKPSKPGNPHWDNEENDLIVGLNDLIGDSTTSYRIVGMLGRGAFGQVVCCINRSNGEEVAIKIAKSPHAYFECGKNEAEILRRLGAANPLAFVKIENEFIFKQHFCIVMEKLDRNLYEFLQLRSFEGFSHAEVKVIAKQIATGMVEMLKIGVVHCDLKPENVLMVEAKSLRIKIVDFGSAFFNTRSHNHYVQSRYYRAPEVISRQDYNGAVDVWSFICIVFELFTGRPFFPGRNNEDQMARILFLFDSDDDDIPMRLFDKDAYLSKESVKQLIFSYSDDENNNELLIDFIYFCLHLKPIDRPGPIEILKHPYLSGKMEYISSTSVDSSGEVIERDLNHPPPITKINRRFTTACYTKNKFTQRKQSNA